MVKLYLPNLSRRRQIEYVIKALDGNLKFASGWMFQGRLFPATKIYQGVDDLIAYK